MSSLPVFNCRLPPAPARTVAVKLTPAAERQLAKTAHPWIYTKSIQKCAAGGQAGDVAVVFRNRDNKVFGIGLYDPGTPIPIKMLHYHGAQAVDAAFFRARVQQAWDWREPLRAGRCATAYRLVYGENDGLPGLIADLYVDVLVVKLYSRIWLPHLRAVLAVLMEVSGCRAVVLRLSRQLQDEDCAGLRDGQVIAGELAGEEVTFEEYGVRFVANVVRGHKTGFFLDHRENRHRVGQLARGKTVLDVFSYAGGFAVHALAGGAQAATALDISRQALALAEANVALNPHSGPLKTIAGDAFEALATLAAQGQRWDIVVIDPPSFAKSRDEIAGALRKYAQLARLGRALVRPGGLLVLASCSSRVTSADFFVAVEQSLGVASGAFERLDQTGHALDHHAEFPEGRYLKCGYYRRVRAATIAPRRPGAATNAPAEMRRQDPNQAWPSM